VPKVKVTRKKDKNQIKTKAKTVNRILINDHKKSQSPKQLKTDLQTDGNRNLDEAVPAATADTETIPES
jgi:hypothetical protein